MSSPHAQPRPKLDQQHAEMHTPKALELPFSPLACTPLSTVCNSPVLFDVAVPRKLAVRRRKGTPARGPESASDVRFQGITFSFANVPLKRSTEDYLHIIDGPRFTEDYASLRQSDEHVVPSPQALQTPSPLGPSEMDSDADAAEGHVDGTDGTGKVKQCACCGCTSTPLWRDLGKNQPLCNACGIRWKKYGVICDSCHYVPCKQERDSRTCRRCANPFMPAAKRTRTGSPAAKRPATTPAPASATIPTVPTGLTLPAAL